MHNKSPLWLNIKYMTVKQSVRLQTKLSNAHQDYKNMLNAYALTKVNDPALSEDLVQQAFMKTWIYLVKNGKIELMKAFLYRVLNNLIVDEYRKHKASSLDAIMEKGYEPKAKEPDSLSNQIDGKRAMFLINDLPEKYKKVMQMRYAEDLSPKEIHLITGQSKNLITVQTFRGLEKLRQLYNYQPAI